MTPPAGSATTTPPTVYVARAALAFVAAVLALAVAAFAWAAAALVRISNSEQIVRSLSR